MQIIITLYRDCKKLMKYSKGQEQLKNKKTLNNGGKKQYTIPIRYSEHLNKFLSKITSHAVRLSSWPIITALCTFSLLANTVLFFHNKTEWTIVTLSIIFLIISMFCWINDVLTEANIEKQHTKLVFIMLKNAFNAFIVSEIMFLFSLFWTFFHSSTAPSMFIYLLWPPANINTLNPYSIPLLNTALLLTSGITLTVAHYGIINRQQKLSIIFLGITILLGLIFELFQFFEYVHCPFNINDSTFGSTFFITTGFHGLHVLVGIIFSVTSTLRLITKISYTTTMPNEFKIPPHLLEYIKQIPILEKERVTNSNKVHKDIPMTRDYKDNILYNVDVPKRTFFSSFKLQLPNFPWSKDMPEYLKFLNKERQNYIRKNKNFVELCFTKLPHNILKTAKFTRIKTQDILCEDDFFCIGTNTFINVFETKCQKRFPQIHEYCNAFCENLKTHIQTETMKQSWYIPDDERYKTTFYWFYFPLDQTVWVSTRRVYAHTVEEFINKWKTMDYKLIKLAKFPFTSENHLGFEVSAYYWHFVDVAWIFLYMIIYINNS